MPDPRLNVHDRVRAIDALEKLAFQANAGAAWLSEHGIETEADMVEGAARDLLAACHLLNRPLRAQLPPERWQPAPGGHPQV